MLIRWFVWGGATWEHLIMTEFEMKYTVKVITKIYSFYLDALPRTSWDWAVVSCMFTLFTVAFFFFWETVHCCLLCLFCFLWRLRLHLLSVMSFHPNKSKEMFRGLLGKHFCKTLAVLMNHSYQFERLKKRKMTQQTMFKLWNVSLHVLWIWWIDFSCCAKPINKQGSKYNIKTQVKHKNIH